MREKVITVIFLAGIFILFGMTFFTLGQKNAIYLTDLNKTTYAFEASMAMKKPLAQANTELTAFLTAHQSLESTQVLMGKNNWLFYKSSSDEDPIGDYQGTNHYNDEQLKTLAAHLVSQRDAMKAEGKRMVLFFLPNKESVYAENMPDNVYRATTQTRMDAAVSYLRENTDLEIVYPKDTFLAAKKPGQEIYYKYDTHWNARGIYLGTQALMQQLYGISDTYEDKKFKVKDRNASGDLAVLCNMTHVFCDDTDLALPTDQLIKGKFKKDNIFVMGDSFSDSITPLLEYYCGSNHVKREEYSAYKAADLKEFNPDVVVVECVERYINRMLEFDLTKDTSEVTKEIQKNSGKSTISADGSKID